MPGVQPNPKDHDRKHYISQSEVRKAQDCPLAWYAEWHLGLRSTAPESRPQRVGSLGHAIVADAVLGRRTPMIAVMDEMRKRGYVRDDIASWDEVDADLLADCDAAEAGANLLLASREFNVGRPVVHNGAPLVEVDLRADFNLNDSTDRFALGSRLLSAAWNAGKRGICGTPDIVHERDGIVFCDDYKFRQKPDLGGTIDAPDSTMPDQQGAWYKLLLRVAGVAPGRDIVFRQLNVYAGRWLTLEDFLREGSPYVTASGLPSRDLKKLEALVTADVWGEAWRTLVEKRRVESLHRTPPKGRKGSGVRLATPTEDWEAKRFVEILAAQRVVQVVEYRLDHSVCVDVVRDMLAAVAALYAQVAAGIIPGRNLRTYERSPCVRPFGCNVQAGCRAALGTGRVEQVLREHAADGRLRLPVVPGSVGDFDGAGLAVTP